VLQLPFDVRQLRIKLILLGRLRGIQILVSHTLCIEAYCLSSETVIYDTKEHGRSSSTLWGRRNNRQSR
jgi:hypothetical protein